MELSERLREQWGLPSDIHDYQEDAIAAEVWWHIEDVFRYDTGVLSPQECRILYARFCHEDANADHELRRVSACNAFAWFVTQYGGPGVFGMREAALLDWRPTTEPFNYFELR